MPFKPDRPKFVSLLASVVASLRLFLRRAALEFLAPWHAMQQFRFERQRYRDIIDDAMASDRYKASEALHRPSGLDVSAYALSACSRGILKWAFTWLGLQAVFSVVVTLSRGRFVALKILLKTPLCWSLVAIDVAIFLVVAVMVIASVRIYGPTSVGFGLTLSLAESTGTPYRAALRAYPRATQKQEIQLKQWRYTKIYVTQLARALARKRLVHIVGALGSMALCWALISFWLSAAGGGLLYIHDKALATDHSVVTHLYFLFVMFATIGLGDVTFTDSWMGHLVGTGIAATVMGMGVGLVTYLNYYVLSLRDRLYGYLACDVGDDAADWLVQSAWMT